MSGYEVSEPILNSPFDEPTEHWHIAEGEQLERRPDRRPAMYFYRDPKAKPDTEAGRVVGTAIELKLVNRIRAQVKKWRLGGYQILRCGADRLSQRYHQKPASRIGS